MKIVFVQHPNNSRNFLFETPVDIKSGELLSVDTMSGTALATASAPSMDIADSSVADFAKFHGAYLPLKKVIGMYWIERFDEKQVEEPQDSPARKFNAGDKVRIVNNTCSHGYKIGEIVEIDLVSETGYRANNDVSKKWYIRDEDAELVEFPACEKPTVHEVKRKAKVGEYIKVVDGKCAFGDYHNGGVYKCVCEETPSGTGRGVQINVVCSGYVGHDEYVVLKGYTEDMYKAYLAGEAK